jgi:hypothetical protein
VSQEKTGTPWFCEMAMQCDISKNQSVTIFHDPH